MCSPVDRKRQSVDQFLVGNHLVLTGRDTGRYSPSFGLSDLLLPAMRAGLLARFLLQGLGSNHVKGAAWSCRRAAWRCRLGFSFGNWNLPREHASQLSTK